MKQPLQNGVDMVARAEPSWFRDSPAPWVLSSEQDLPQRLIDMQYAADVAAAPAEHDPAAHRRGRVEAVRIVQIAAAQTNALDLELLVRDALRAFQFGNAPGITVEGPTILIRPTAAVLLALMLHEWATNSMKFGMLAGLGRDPALRVRWLVTQDHVELSWQETRVPIVRLANIHRNGFGMRMVEQILPLHLDATSSFSLLPGGVDCTLILPDSIIAY